jgi:septal ring factor EnvC (AmiA/AmiB activator)
MNKLAKVASIIVIVTCLGSLFLAYSLSDMKKKHLARIAELDSSLTTTKATLARTESKLKQTETDLAKTKSDLEQTSATLQTTKAALDQKTQEADTLKTQVADQGKQLQKTTTDLAAAQGTLNTIYDVLKKAGITDIGGLDKLGEKIQSLSDENKVLGQQLTSIHNENQQLKEKVEYLSTTPVGLRGRIQLVQAKWGFVVMDVGHAQRVQPNAEFLVYRDSKFVGKVQVVSVAADNCIAQILPDYLRRPPQPGDLVVH